MTKEISARAFLDQFSTKREHFPPTIFYRLDLSQPVMGPEGNPYFFIIPIAHTGTKVVLLHPDNLGLLDRVSQEAGIILQRWSP